MVRVAIVGTAGRKGDGPKMSRALYGAMLREAWDFLCEEFEDFTQVKLVSGGAAWADHVAVSLYRLGQQRNRPFAGLELHFPCPFINSRFVGYTPKQSRVASVAMHYHRIFSTKVNVGSLRSLQRAIDEEDVEYTVSEGFFARNSKVADCDVILAFTWGEGTLPKDGGTRNTWDQSRAPVKRHFPLSALEVNE